MNRVICYIDGLNLYHALMEKDRRGYRRYSKYRWIDLYKLASCVITSFETLERVYYFTALAYWNNEKVKRHKTLIRALEYRNVIPIYGEFKLRDGECPLGGRFKKHEEKQTDVYIAMQLYRQGRNNEYDTAVIISGDSDLIPAIRSVHHEFPHKKTGVVIPVGRISEGLKRTCHFHRKMKEEHLRASLFEIEIDTGNGVTITCPEEWIAKQ